MKSIIEYMATIVIMMLISFMFVSFIAIEMQITYARNYHTRVIEDIQNGGNYAHLDTSKYDKNISLKLNNDNTVEVCFDYNIQTPFFGTMKGQKLIGYAR